MGMDLAGADLSYNWAGWRSLLALLKEWEVDLSEFRGTNDGDSISPETCKAVADAIEAHLHEVDSDTRKWLIPQISKWRDCNGCFQY